MEQTVSRSSSPLRGVLVTLGISALALIVAQFAILPVAIMDPNIIDGLQALNRNALTVAMVLNFVALALAGVIYMRIANRGWEWVDLSFPSVRDFIWMVGGTVLFIGFLLLIGIIATILDIPAAESDVVLLLEDDVTMILIMIGIVWLFNSPAEEFLFRNVIQKRLYESFSEWGAIVVASLIFIAFHIPSYLTLAQTPMATVVSLTVLFGGSVLLGYTYVKTENLLVPIVIHGVYNSILLLQLLLFTIYDIDPDMQAMRAMSGL